MVPLEFKPFLWSYDFEKLDISKNKKIIIENILNFGSFETTQKLFALYSTAEIKEVLNNMRLSSFNKQSVNYWNTILNNL